VVWLAATPNYAQYYPTDRIFFHVMAHSCTSGLAWNLGYPSSGSSIDEEIEKEIEQTIREIKPRLVLDLHTEQYRKYERGSSVYASPSVVTEKDFRLRGFPFYSKTHEIEDDTYSVIWHAIQKSPRVKSYTVEFDFGGLEPTKRNIATIRKCYGGRKRTKADIEAFRKQVFEHPQFARDIVIARDFIHFLYELNV